MEVITHENIAAFDVDDTLVMWDSQFERQDFPYDPELRTKVPITDPYDGSVNYLKPHRKHINLLKKYKGRGMLVVVWSAAGYKWAEAVVKALGIEEYVDYILTKPTKLIDDLTPNEVFGTRIYLKDE